MTPPEGTQDPVVADRGQDDAAFERLLEHLRESRAFDFTGYKRASLRRRVDRRMHVVGISDHEEYLDHLQVHPEEFSALFNSILINVTSFFRDPDAWELLREQVVPELVAGRPDEPIRIWSAGCASGQEAYTLAMCLAEAMPLDEFRTRVKIYATDVDEEALSEARAGSYSEREVASVPSDLRNRYFEVVSGRWTFRKDLRRSVIFGRNDLVQDAPISRVRLVTCRNALMYLNSETQGRVLTRLAYALDPDGVLVLGKAEMMLGHPELFEPVDLKQRMFRKSDRTVPVERGLVVAPLHSRERSTALAGLGELRHHATMASPVAQLTVTADGVLAAANHRACALFGVHERDLGRPFQDLEVSYRPVELRSSLDQAAAQRRPVFLRDVDWLRGPGERLALEVEVIPLVDDGRLLGLTLAFTDVTRYRQLQDELEVANRQLETAYEELQSTNEELETTNEELQSTVEELETTNEELQSTNEELETMNEELQSMNDALQSVNEGLRDDSTEVEDTNRFMSVVLGSLATGVVVVDARGVVRVWNVGAQDQWGVRQDEALGADVLSLDTGLPRGALTAALDDALHASRPTDAVVPATNRCGRPVRLRLQVTSLVGDDGSRVEGALLRMDDLDDVGDAVVAQGDASAGARR